MRLGMRQIEAEKRGKQKNFRQCYIGLKVTSVPCRSDGTVSSRYTPRTNHHPFDTAIPQAGENFFEDMLVNPSEELNPTGECGASAFTFTDHTEVDSSRVNLGEGGANFLRFAQLIAQKRGKAASKAPSRPSQSNTPLSLGQNQDTALPVFPHRSRKRRIVIDDDEDYMDALEDEEDVLGRPAKRHRKSTMTTPTASAAKEKTGQPMKSTYSTPVAPAAKPKTGRPTRKRS
ncbi:uncharacterized protein ALTATR162_LOCUS1156 [Alternaria atra]|uniref:Uncharacterized protein n=1 Tax=Alternaria atra TaxID=119953 RepID=A0A8J2HWA8_9PLEO|nr:uncharacterized protein ALTATR162_LOCUS1156 [Alternaria atra]CAG5142462.1 unnamed protein product [Alternaria atra]